MPSSDIPRQRHSDVVGVELIGGIEKRELYESAKKELAARDWPDMNAYPDAKTEVIAGIKHRARART